MTSPITPIRCRTCLFWRKGGAPSATTMLIPDANADLGVCEFDPPTIQPINGGLQSFFPAVHADRRCSLWVSGVDDSPPPRGNVIPIDFGSAA